MKDKLDVIFECQQKLDAFLIEKRGLNFTPSEWIQKETLAMISELGELLDEARFKWWKNPQPVDGAKVKEELVDILHFFIGMCLNAGMTSDELFKIYLEKNEENFKRQFGTSLKEGYALAAQRANV
ncbi:MAG: dUTPase [Clostridiales bacterium]|jgi:dimeric dUTPase (all-alpha-NTP-PPase superfamily)|nr:dUTPase [Clostridiales bacterium]